MPSRLRESLALILLALLPFHALGVTVVTRIVAGPVHAPLSVLALWKEALLGVILLVALVEIVRSARLRAFWKIDRLDGAVIVLAAALLISTALRGTPGVQALYGLRYDLVPLAAFLVLRRVEWSTRFLRRAPFILAIAAVIAALYALVTLLLPDAFFLLLGYSDLHSLYVPSRPIAAFQQIGGTAIRRLQGPMSGPNQFGMWLAMLLPFASSLPDRWKRVFVPLLLLTLVFTFSRAAWIAAAAVLSIASWPAVRRLSTATITVGCIGILSIALSVLTAFPSILLRVESSADHIRNPLRAMSIMLQEPLGRGLGSAGPAHNRVSDSCVFLTQDTDASWAAVHPALCVFVGETQVQPLGRACDCPLLPENWYLQLGVEGGWIAFAAFITLTVWILGALRHSSTTLAQSLFLSFLAVSLAALFLHAYEDAAVAYTVWILLAITLPSRRAPPAVGQWPNEVSGLR